MQIDKINKEMERLMEMKQRILQNEATLQDLLFCESIDELPHHFDVPEKEMSLFDGSYYHIVKEGSHPLLASPILHIHKENAKYKSGLLWKKERKYTPVITTFQKEIVLRNTFLERIQVPNRHSIFYLTNLEGKTFSFENGKNAHFKLINVRTPNRDKIFVVTYDNTPVYAHNYNEAEFISKEEIQSYFRDEPLSSVLEKVIDHFDDTFMKGKILEKK